MKIDFEELSISNDFKTLAVKVSLTNGAGENYRINRIAVDTCLTLNELLDEPSSDVVVDEKFNSTTADIEVNSDTEFKNKVMFVWVGYTDGVNTKYEMVPLVNWYFVYCRAMTFIKMIPCNNCKAPVEFIDFILKIRGMEYAFKAGFYTQGIRLWKSIFKKTYSDGPDSTISSSDCGCK